jgi:hypothetical protein
LTHGVEVDVVHPHPIVGEREGEIPGLRTGYFTVLMFVRKRRGLYGEVPRETFWSRAVIVDDGFRTIIGHLQEELENRADLRRRTSRQAVEQRPK